VVAPRILILANVGAVATTLLGVLGLFLPDKVAAFVSIAPAERLAVK
jgi:hypothetical protein